MLTLLSVGMLQAAPQAPPGVWGLSPSSGPESGGDTVRISGVNFTGVNAVTFGMTPAWWFRVETSTSIVAIVPAGSGTVDVRVTNSSGTSFPSPGSRFTYVGRPNIYHVSPNSGPSSGNTSVTISGSNFAGATSVSFGDVEATSFTVNSANSITATSPSGTGTVDIRVTTAAGTSVVSPGAQFTYGGAPTITSVSPNTGPSSGGTSVTITGSNFTGATAVVFGGTAATSFTVNSATSMTATSPSGTGTVDVRVTTASGTSAVSAADQFTYAGVPTVTGISPNDGPTTGGRPVVITGTNFRNTTAVMFGANRAPIKITSDTSIVAYVPEGTGIVDVRVTTPEGTSATSPAALFTYVGTPTVSGVSPSTGPATGGTSVTITGSDFTQITNVAFGSTAASSFTVNSPTSITATSPSGTGTVDIRVTNTIGTSAVSASDQFTYVSAPTVTAVAPGNGPPAGGTSVTITGTNLSGATSVSFGGAAATNLVVVNATTLRATTPAHAPGAVNVVVVTPGGSATGTSLYTYTAAPTVSAVAPNSGPIGGGTSVTISGANLTGTTAVTFGGTAASNVAVVNATTVTATAPAHAAGVVDVAITTPGGTASGSGLYTYVAGPTITSVAPASGLASGGSAVTISGSNFGGATGVSFGGTAATSFSVISATTISATTPPHAAGAVNVVVTTPSGAATGGGLYTYVRPETSTTLTSSRNPSEVGQAVTFTASVTAAGATPAGTVIFSDGGKPIGTAALAGGVASFTTASLQLGSHSITAAYAGSGSFAASTSPALLQAVNTPQDSLKLRALQIIGSKVAAQTSGGAISGAIDSAISEGFAGGGGLIAPSGSGIRFNFSADSEADEPQAFADPTSRHVANGAGQSGPSGPAGGPSRFHETFAALDRSAYDKARKTPAAYREAKEWMLWADLRGSFIGRFDNPTTLSPLSGHQVNGLFGLTRRLTPDLLTGAVAGYERFDFRSDALNGRLTGEGWTTGGYVGWRFGGGLQFDAAATYSSINYDGSAGTASGQFDGRRVLVAGGLSGRTDLYGIGLEPSARVFALWEHQKDYVDSLGTAQASRDFFTGRASAGVKATVSWLTSATFNLAPYVGAYSDYYFNGDTAQPVALTGAVPLSSVAFLDGWSARFTGGIAARLDNGAVVAVGAELGGLGGNTQIWTFRGQASVPF